MKTGSVIIRRLEDEDREWVREICTREWGTPVMISRGRQFDISRQQGFVAEIDGERVGMVTYEVMEDECEIGGLLSTIQGKGAGTALLKAAEEEARAQGSRRLWLVTTNDNIEALRFYQRHGFELVAVHRGAINETRRTVKPDLPETGNHGIPVRDEIELEIVL